VREPNISAWRRAVCGDLTSAFNFADPNHETLPALQTTTRQAADSLRQRQEKLLPVPLPSAGQQLAPQQQRLARPSRALPYRLHVDSQADPKARTLSLSLQNTGEQGAVLHVYDGLHLSEIPRRYTVEAGKALQDSWPVVERYQLWVLGPNGFHRSFHGDLKTLQPELLVTTSNSQLQLTLSNPGEHGVVISIDRCPYTQQGPWTLAVPARGEVRQVFAYEGSGGWYDLTLRSDGGWLRRIAGRLETGAHSISDPLMGRA